MRAAGEPKQDRSRATRQRLLEATVHCLAELGWSAATVSVIADEAGISRGALQHHFPTRQELIAAVATLPRGAVVLPGLDLDLAASGWDGIDTGEGFSRVRVVREDPDERADGEGRVAEWGVHVIEEMIVDQDGAVEKGLRERFAKLAEEHGGWYDPRPDA